MLGLEPHNIDFFVNHSLALSATKYGNTIQTIRLLADEGERNRLVENQTEMFSGNAAADIMDCVEQNPSGGQQCGQQRI